MGACVSLLPVAYSTHKEVKLLDRKLGILYLTCILLVLGYVVGVRVIVYQEYNAMEKAYGIAGVTLNGTTYTRIAGDGAVSPYDVASLAVQGTAVFVPTRIVSTTEQYISNCTNPDSPCSEDSECESDPPLLNGVCDPAGYCMGTAWCNSSGTSLYANPFATSAAHAGEEIIQNLSTLKLVIISSISFTDLGQGELSTEDGRKAKHKWPVSTILARAKLDEFTAIHKGVVLSLVLQWNCTNLFRESDCRPHLHLSETSQLSSEEPFMKSWASFYRRSSDTSIQYRDAHQARGVWMLVRAEGYGKRIDALQIVRHYIAISPAQHCAAD
jgi:hypothetical protein